MCGTTRREDALFAVSQGVDAIGFIFFAKSPRYIGPDKAGAIIHSLPPFVDSVGVFVNTPIEELVRIQREAGLAYLQLHGSETVEYCKELQGKLPGIRLIKAFRVSQHIRREDFAGYDQVVSGFLLDTYVQGEPGGTGMAFDWAVIDPLKLQRPLILAGGLNADNVSAALKTIRPYAVDINSGVEIAPGIKDHRKLEEIIAKIGC